MLADLARYAIATSVALTVGVLMGYRPGGGVPGVAAGESVLGSGYGVANAAFPTQGVLSVPTAQGTYTELIAKKGYFYNLEQGIHQHHI